MVYRHLPNLLLSGRPPFTSWIAFARQDDSVVRYNSYDYCAIIFRDTHRTFIESNFKSLVFNTVLIFLAMKLGWFAGFVCCWTELQSETTDITLAIF